MTILFLFAQRRVAFITTLTFSLMSCTPDPYKAVESVAFLEKANHSLSKKQIDLDQKAIQSSRAKEAARPLNSLFASDILDVDFQLDQPTITGSDYLAPKVTKAISPQYPTVAVKRQIQGTVTTVVSLNIKGAVTEAKVIKSSDEIFNQAAIKAAKQWKFIPASYKDAPVSCTLSIPFSFVLKEK